MATPIPFPSGSKQSSRHCKLMDAQLLSPEQGWPEKEHGSQVARLVGLRVPPDLPFAPQKLVLDLGWAEGSCFLPPHPTPPAGTAAAGQAAVRLGGGPGTHQRVAGLSSSQWPFP